MYLCSMGANLAPEENFAKARSKLTPLGEVHYSRAVYTKPVDIDTEHDFLNSLFVISTQLDAEVLKMAFNKIEIELGRDRDDPDCSQKDRPMDLDILGAIDEDVWQTVPDYLQAVVPSLQPIAQSLTEQDKIPL
ncbi:MAG TPA: 2-amino-4-hydroxy-6-hydroxymethyldihydropteridine diphosphokinase [Pseudidiomarina sp.]|nr:2-amino-4-hydroxy-6-hydroxymethyldihydropteridine diphosphokinase [Pseudidiomarina sp.]